MQVGIIMLIGLLAKTAILITEYACERRREGMPIAAAALDAAKARLRPILMTALTLIVGLMPMIFERGAGAMGNVTLGLCVVGGMLVGDGRAFQTASGHDNLSCADRSLPAVGL